jgi:hypothetical protein
MNDYTMVKNALVAIALVVLLMIALQPSKMANAVLGWNTMSQDALQAIQVNTNGPSELQAADSETVNFTISTQDFMLPKKYSVTTEIGSSTISKDEAVYRISVHEFDGALSDTALKLAEAGMNVRPVMHGSNLFYDIADNEAIVLAVQDLGEGKYVKIVPDGTYDHAVVHELLSQLKTL